MTCGDKIIIILLTTLNVSGDVRWIRIDVVVSHEGFFHLSLFWNFNLTFLQNDSPNQFLEKPIRT